MNCTWIVRVPSNHPEPDSEADCWREIECGAPVEIIRYDVTDDSGWSDGWRCESGHEHRPITQTLAPFGAEWEAEKLDRERA